MVKMRSGLRSILAALVVCSAFGCGQGAERAEPGESVATTETSTQEAAPPTSTTFELQGQKAVEVTLVDHEIRMPNELPEGPASFKVTNSGQHEHSFEIEGQGIEQKLDRPLQPLEVATLTADLKPGTYEVYCPVADHAEAKNMRTTITVVPAAPGATPAGGTATSTGG